MRAKPSGRRPSKRRSKNPAHAPDKPVISETASIHIDEIASRGDGIGLYSGRKIQIALTAPGDVITAKIAGDSGWIEAIEVSGPDRIEPICALYGECGGCSLQHLSPTFQTNWKRQLVIDALAGEGVDCPEIAASPLFPSASRRRATLSVRRAGHGIEIGFKARRTHRIVPMTQCHIVTPSLFAMVGRLDAIVRLLPTVWTEFSIKMTECDNGFDLDLIGDIRVGDIGATHLESLGQAMHSLPIKRISIGGEPILFTEPLQVNFDGIGVELPPGGFLQASIIGQNALLARVQALLAGWKIKKASRVADLFSGCGAFCLPLARDYQVYAADNDQAGIAALKQAARRASNLRPIEAEVRDLFRRPIFSDELNKVDVVIFDPPRAGAPAQAKELIRSTVPYLIAVSCNPASFARDARILGKGGYRLTQIALVDQFTWSPHIELVAGFVKG